VGDICILSIVASDWSRNNLQLSASDPALPVRATGACGYSDGESGWRTLRIQWLGWLVKPTVLQQSLLLLYSSASSWRYALPVRLFTDFFVQSSGQIPGPDFSCYISEYKEINSSNIDSYKRGYELDNTRETNSENGHYQNQSLSKRSRDIRPLSLIPEEF
jgi:hypothetical protein